MDKVVILGARGMVGGQLRKLLPEATSLDRDTLDATDESALRHTLLELRPTVIINCIAYNDVDGAESNRDAAFRLNETLPANLARISNELGALLIQYSTGYVFGENQQSYNEDDTPHPLSIYAQSKLAGEQAVKNTAARYYIIRTNTVFGPAGESASSKTSFVDLMLNLAKTKTELKLVNDEVNSITYAPDLAKATIGMIETKPAYGIYHITNEGSASWYEFAQQIFSIKSTPITLLPVAGTEFPRPAKRAHRYVINNTKLPALRSWQSALQEYLT